MNDDCPEPVKEALYDWSDVEDKYNWIAKDRSGIVCKYKNKPEKIPNCWAHIGLGYKETDKKTDANWEESLESRPTCQNPRR